VNKVAIDQHGRRGADAQALDLGSILDLDDLDGDTSRLRGAFDDADRRLALAAAGPQNFDLHLYSKFFVGGHRSIRSSPINLNMYFS
jgi:hypothetical protein